MHKKIWTAARGQLKNTLDEDANERLISQIEPVSLENGIFKLAVDNYFLQLWLEPYIPKITEAVKTAAPEGAVVARVDLVVDESIVPPNENAGAAAGGDSVPDDADGTSAAGGGTVSRARHDSAPNTPRTASFLNPNFTFEEFIDGPSPSHAYSAAIAVAADPGRFYNPLLIHGEVGLGKTHLMQAIAHSVIARKPKAAVKYISAEAMWNDFTESIQAREMPDFRKRYRKLDMLLVDDIQFIAGKESIREEFFNIYNALHNAQKHIVMTSDVPPGKIQGLDARMISRFQQGLVTDIKKPSFETRLAILRHKQRNFSTRLPDEFLNFIAENITLNVRQLEGALIKIVSDISLTKKQITLDMLPDLLKDIIEEGRRPALTFLEIQTAVAKNYGVQVDDMSSEERPQSVALPRQIAMFLCRKLTTHSLSEIGDAFKKNHSTIVHACKAIIARLDTEKDGELKRNVYSIVERLGRDPATHIGGERMRR